MTTPILRDEESLIANLAAVPTPTIGLAAAGGEQFGLTSTPYGRKYGTLSPYLRVI